MTNYFLKCINKKIFTEVCNYFIDKNSKVRLFIATAVLTKNYPTGWCFLFCFFFMRITYFSPQILLGFRLNALCYDFLEVLVAIIRQLWSQKASIWRLWGERLIAGGVSHWWPLNPDLLDLSIYTFFHLSHFHSFDFSPWLLVRKSTLSCSWP